MVIKNNNQILEAALIIVLLLSEVQAAVLPVQTLLVQAERSTMERSWDCQVGCGHYSKDT
jgi:hypothetical protein